MCVYVRERERARERAHARARAERGTAGWQEVAAIQAAFKSELEFGDVIDREVRQILIFKTCLAPRRVYRTCRGGRRSGRELLALRIVERKLN